MNTIHDTRKGFWSVWAIALIFAGVLGACDKLVETEPLGRLTSDTFFETPDQAVQATNATYSMLREWQVHVFSWLGLTDIVSDDATKGSTPADASFLGELDDLTFDSGNLAFIDPWTGYYRGIYRANVAIQGIEGIDMDQALKDRLLGENKFLRAYFYFFLVRAWGGVPLITEPLAPGEYEQPRATREAVYDLIEQDLLDAIAGLPEKSQYDPEDLGRATKGAARAMLAQVYLYQEDYTNALKYAQEVINSGEYSLYPNYNTLFTDAGENSSESVFEVQAVALPQAGGGIQYAEVQGVRGTPGIGWGFNQPSSDLVAAYEPGDPRLQATVLFPWELIPDGSDLVVHMNTQVTNQQYNQKAFVSPSNPGGTWNSGLNLRRIRYADVLLVAAEAAYRTGDEGLARQYLNLVRRRARGDQQVTLGIIPERLSNDIATGVLGLGAGTSRVFVRYVHPDGPAAAAGLESFQSQWYDYADDALIPVLVQHMDLIRSVNGIAVTTLDSYYDALESLGPIPIATLQVTRITQQAQAGGTATTNTQSTTAVITTAPLLPDITVGGQALLDAIWHERRVELAMEQQRWFDLIRQGRAPEVMNAIGKPFVEGKHELYPIPRAEVEQVGLEQNPGYI